MENRLIPSFGRRKVRTLKETSQKAYTELLPHLALNPSQPFTDQTFSDIWLEIGFGGGEHMVQQLKRNPSIAMIGCEPFMNGVAKLLNHLDPEDYARVRIWHEDVRYLFPLIPPSFFSRVFILFPDPWPKKRHHKRRLITRSFMDDLWPTLKEGAILYIASDDPSYVEQIQDVLYGYPRLSFCSGPSSSNPSTWKGRPEGWPETRYEKKALSQGKACAYMIFQKEEKKA